MDVWLIVLLALAVLFIILSTARYQLHPFLALILAAFGFGILAGMPLQEVLKSITDGFGGTVGYIGIVIIAGTIIGTFLEKSGGAYTMADSILALTGRKRVPLAMSVTGYIVSIPVFCDSGFIILSALNRALTKRAGLTLATTAIALSLGLYATHTMVPPTPGPIAAAGIIGADLGLVILWGLLVAFAAMLAGLVFAKLYAARFYIDPEPQTTQTEIEEKETRAPSAAKAFVPIVLPMALIVLKSVADLPAKPFGTGWPAELIRFVGSPVTALMIGVLIAFLLPRKLDRKMLSTSGWVGEAVLAAGIIIMITASGGAFGKVLQNSGIAGALGGFLSEHRGLGVLLPFVIAAAIKTAQGSSTVAIITTASLMAPLMATLGLDSPTAKALTVVAIGAGSMVVSHANDSFFWVVSQFSGMDVRTAYKLQTVGTLVEGVAAGALIWIISLILL